MIGKTNVKTKPNKKRGIDYIDYIEGTGTQYIDTGVVPTSKTKWVYEYQFLTNVSSGTGSNSQNGCGIGNDNKRFNISYNTNGTFGAAIGVNGASTVAGDTNKHKFILDAVDKKAYIDGILLTECNYNSLSATDSICFFTRNENGTKSAFIHAGRLYGSKIYEDSVLIRDFRPAKDGAGVYCLYDEVEKKYYYNQGTGEFEAPKDLIVTREILDQGEFKNVTPTYLTNQVDGSDGFTITGRADISGSGSWSAWESYLLWLFKIDLTDYKTISFYAKQNALHGLISVKVLNEFKNEQSSLAGVGVEYGNAPTEWTKYTIDVSGINGVKNVVFMGGYRDKTGSTSSSTSYCNIKFLV